MPEFSLRFPFELHASHVIRDVDQPLKVRVGERELVFTIRNKQANSYVLMVTGFASLDDASRFVANTWSALANLLVDRTIPFDAPFQVSPVQYLPKPMVSPNFPQFGIVHGTVDEGQAVAYPSEQRVVVFGVGTPTVSVSSPGVQFLTEMAGWASRPFAAAVAADERLRTAIELYSGSFAESSRRARFLTLVMVLEVLTERQVKHVTAVALVDRWAAETEAVLKGTDDGSEEQEGLEALKRELFFRRDKSIRSRVRSLVQVSLHRDPAVAKYAREAVEAYDKRGSLVHEGTLDEAALTRASENARIIVQKVLRARMDAITASGAA